MSAEAYKRDTVRAWCEAVVSALFVPSINENDRPVEGAIWFTVEWEPDTVEPLAFCGVVQETGLLNVIVGGEPDQGDNAVALTSDAVVAELMAKADPLAALVLERANSTAEHSAGTADRWYRLQTPISYRYINGGP